jgi:hypothetical protein
VGEVAPGTEDMVVVAVVLYIAVLGTAAVGIEVVGIVVAGIAVAGTVVAGIVVVGSRRAAVVGYLWLGGCPCLQVCMAIV